MTRCSRLALLLALAAALALPHGAAASPPDRSDAGLLATAEGLLARLWAPLARLVGGSGAAGGRYMAPCRPSARLPASIHAASEGGPMIDPNGFTTPPPPNNAETDGGPHIDPDG